jgi:hypothetical protein
MRVMLYSFCESIHAGPQSAWHIRRRGPDESLKTGGGIQTAGLCGHPKSGQGWDLEVPLDESHFAHSCVECVRIYRERGE